MLLKKELLSRVPVALAAFLALKNATTQITHDPASPCWYDSFPFWGKVGMGPDPGVVMTPALLFAALLRNARP